MKASDYINIVGAVKRVLSKGYVLPRSQAEAIVDEIEKEGYVILSHFEYEMLTGVPK